MDNKQKVYETIRQIPKGKVATYGQIAGMIGKPKAARFIGYCMRTNTDVPRTPCHRIVASDGSLTGYSAGDGIPTKKQMLQKEGVRFLGNKVDLAASQWVV